MKFFLLSFSLAGLLVACAAQSPWGSATSPVAKTHDTVTPVAPAKAYLTREEQDRIEKRLVDQIADPMWVNATLVQREALDGAYLENDLTEACPELDVKNLSDDDIEQIIDLFFDDHGNLKKLKE